MMNAEIILNVMMALFLYQIGWSLFVAVLGYFKDDEE